LQTRGADITAGYRLDMAAAGKLNFTFNGTYTAQLQITPTASGPTAGETYDCAGYFGSTCGTPTPKVRTKMRVTYSTPLEGLDVSAQWRRIGQALNETRSPNPLLASDTLPQFSRFPVVNYLDLSVSYELNKMLGMRIGANNLLDKDPPRRASSDFFGSAFVNGNTYPQVYDALGRYLYANVTLNF
jgi:iron complex outermembrane recepter protein